ncbi:MAG TPA: aminoacyl-tRNA hydrolase [Acidimicrobiales bacterium]|nr:aminoacyl-tRNA hydrolase [Acidimicrobiales bacterium]
MFRSRTGTPADWLVVGLGNPGEEYAQTRHNLGAEVVALLAARHGGSLRAGKERALSCEVVASGVRLALAFPLTFMNLSGESVVRLVKRHGIEEVARVVVVHDELDLPSGRLKVKAGGGVAGHNGLQSVKQHLHSADFVRIRMGIGKPPGRQAGADYVLKRPGKAERASLEVLIQEAADAMEMIATDGVAAAMNRFNTGPATD